MKHIMAFRKCIMPVLYKDKNIAISQISNMYTGIYTNPYF